MSQRRVLLIEREPVVAEAILGFLAGGGDIAEQVPDAGGLSPGADLPDLVLVRAELGDDLDGCAVADTIKVAEATRHLPVVIYAAAAELLEAHRAGPVPADAYLVLPFSGDALLDQVHLLTDGVALSAAHAEHHDEEHLVAEEEVDGDLEALFGELPFAGQGADPELTIPFDDGHVPGSQAPESALAAPEVIPPAEGEAVPGPAAAAGAPEALHDADEEPLSESDDVSPIAGVPPPALEAADAELEALVAGLDASVLESTKEIPAMEDMDLDVLAEGVLPVEGASDGADAVSDAPSLDAAVHAEFGAELPPPPAPSEGPLEAAASPPPSEVAASAVEAATPPPSEVAAPAPAALAPDEPVPGGGPLSPPPEVLEGPGGGLPVTSMTRVDTYQIEAALEAAGEAAEAAAQDAESARRQVEEIAQRLEASEDAAAAERARGEALGREVAQLRGELAASGDVAAELAQVRESAESASAEAERVAGELAAARQELEEARAEADGLRGAAVEVEAELVRSRETSSQMSARVEADAAVFQRVAKAVRIASALIEERSAGEPEAS